MAGSVYPQARALNRDARAGSRILYARRMIGPMLRGDATAVIPDVSQQEVFDFD